MKYNEKTANLSVEEKKHLESKMISFFNSLSISRLEEMIKDRKDNDESVSKIKDIIENKKNKKN